ncbi:MAG: 5'-3' exonuclease [Actinomycetota bacterium]
MDASLTLLVDASSLIYRAFFSSPDTIRAPDGSSIHAAHGFLNMLERLIEGRNPDFLCCAADEDWRPEWRVKLIDTYKTQRTDPASTQQQVDRQVAGQIEVLSEVLSLCGVPFVGHPDHEAEDVIGTLAERAPGRVAIVSGDRDLFQLVRDPAVFVLYPKRGVSVVDTVDEAYIESRYGIPGRAYRDYAVLRGDPSDGLPGVRGIGEKIAGSLLARHGSLDAVLAAAAKGGGTVLTKVHNTRDYIERALQVTTIPTDLPIPKLDLTRPRAVPEGPALEFAARHGLTGPTRRLIAALGSNSSS